MVKVRIEKKPLNVFQECTDAMAGYRTEVHINTLEPTYLAGLIYRCSLTSAQQTQ